MRLFNPITMTEVLPEIHDVNGAVKLSNDNWFFKTKEIPEGMELAVNNNGEPILVEINLTPPEV